MTATRVMSILYGLDNPPSADEAAAALLEVEARPELFLTTGTACAAYEMLKDYVEGGFSCNG
jgi:hypothetical protein